MGAHSNELPAVPEVHFSIVDSEALLPPHVDNKLLEDFGFNDGKPWTLIPSGTIPVAAHPSLEPVASTSGSATEAVASTSTAPATTTTNLDGATASNGLTFEPTHDSRYLRWLQPMESELAHQVEYDMDEQGQPSSRRSSWNDPLKGSLLACVIIDQVWLDGINASRKVEGAGPVSYEIFEIIVDKLEKEWFDLMKSIPKKPNPLLDTDSKCAICDDGECENSNAIVFCDGCNLAVHQDCYGVPYIPEGQWLCRKCTVSPDKPVRCVLCPNSYGAFKQTTTAHWAHLLCAIWIPDTGVSNTVYMEPIDGIENISKSRWKLDVAPSLSSHFAQICSLCRQRVGACIQCANRNCFTAFHVTCARDHGLELKMKQQTGTGELKAYCEKHSGGFTAGSVTPLGTCRDRPGRASLGAHAPSLSTSLQVVLANPKATSMSTKTQRAYKKSYTSGPPLVPSYILDRVNTYVSRIKIANKRQFMNQLCRYWSLKRESRRGAPLLKRLHLEPWTASASTRQQSDVERAKKLELMRLLREDLENVRMLTERVRKRERKKLERAQLLSRFVEQHVFAREVVMGDFIRRVSELDKHRFFAKPVSRRDAPDYYDIVKNPMDFSQMTDKLARREYPSAESLLVDFHLIFDNAFLYNKKETTVHRAASKLLEVSKSLVEDLKRLDDPMSDENILGRYLDLVLTDEVVDALFEFDPAKEEEGKGVADIVMQLLPTEADPAVQETRKDVMGEGATTEEVDTTTATQAVDDAIISTTTSAAAQSIVPTPATKTTLNDDHSAVAVEAEAEALAQVDSLPNPATKGPSTREDVVIEETAALPYPAPHSTEPTPSKSNSPKSSAKDETISKTATKSTITEPTNSEAVVEETREVAGPSAIVAMDVNPPEPAAEKPTSDRPIVEAASTPTLTVAVTREIGKARSTTPLPLFSEDSTMSELSSVLSSAVSEDSPSVEFKDAESDFEREVEDVDDMRSFKMFDSGWVLPEGSSRKAKNAIVEKGKGGQNTVSDNVEEKGKGKEKEKENTNDKRPVKGKGKAKEVETKAQEQSDPDAPPKKKRGRPRKIPIEEVQEPKVEPAPQPATATAPVQPPKSTGLESTSLDTPKKALGPPQAPPTLAEPTDDAAAEGGDDQAKESTTTGATAKKARPPAKIHGTLSIASTVRRVEVEMASKGLPAVPNPAAVKKEDAVRIEAFETNLARVERSSLVTADTQLKEGDLVWARSPGFPFFPAEVLDYPFTTPETREQMRSHRPKNAEADELVPILFFDPYRTSRWAKRDDLRLLGMNDEFDAMLATYDASLRLIFRRKMSNAHPTAAKLAEEIGEALRWARAIKSGSAEARKMARVGKSKEELRNGEGEEDAAEDEDTVGLTDPETKRRTTRSTSMSASTAGRKRTLIERDEADHEESSRRPATKKTKV
ncbi:BQ5605_C027g10317 [Microbotryum silenes-dioicae]|uniref:BQ5605_C027g10317 protein n=1 Tax=Microbotryum silenes-dioicae TaxID=796604 RepID=A0A2X0MQV5_9BASI|nr:BQ5605_C027g10317 [Microbotryum silenes-dioicae]